MYSFVIFIIFFFFLVRFSNITIQQFIFDKINDFLCYEVKPKLNYYKIFKYINTSFCLYLFAQSFLFGTNNSGKIYMLISLFLILLFIKENTEIRNKMVINKSFISKDKGIQVSLKEISFNKKNGLIQSRSNERLQKIMKLKEKKII